jgi:cytochrome c peroxidase
MAMPNYQPGGLDLTQLQCDQLTAFVASLPRPVERTPSPHGKALFPNVTSDSSGLLSDEWRTPPLWGVADSAPYLHDGRASTLEEAIKLHGGQGATAAANFQGLHEVDQAAVITFLRTLRAP